MSTAQDLRLDQKTLGKIELFMIGKKCLIVEKSGLLRNVLRKMMNTFGIIDDHLFYSKSVPDAHKMIKEHRPEFILSESDLENGTGLDICQEHHCIIPNRGEAALILVVNKMTDFYRAQLYDNNVDGYLGPDLTMDIMQKDFYDIIKEKMTPTLEFTMIEQAKELIYNEDFEQAESILQKATVRGRKGISFFLLGQLYERKQLDALSEMTYRKGGKLDKNCWHLNKRLYQLWKDKNDDKRCWELLTNFRRYQVVPLEYLGDYIKLAFQMGNREEANRFLTNLEANLKIERDDEIKSSLALGLVSAGEYLAGKDLDCAVKLFKLASTYAKENTKVTDKIINTLYAFKLIEIANELISFWDIENYVPRFILDVYELQMGELEHGAKEMMTTAMRLYKDDIKIPIVYEIIIKSFKANNKDQEVINEYFEEAISAFPELEDHFRDLLK